MSNATGILQVNFNKIKPDKSFCRLIVIDNSDQTNYLVVRSKQQKIKDKRRKGGVRRI